VSPRKRIAQPSGDAGTPRASRPHIPTEYGVPRDAKRLLPWSHVSERMAAAAHYWICTVGANGQPHATPVDGLWIDDQLFFGGSSQTRRSRNLAANPAVCVHLPSADDVVRLQGEAHLHTPDRALATRLAEASAAKYGYGQKPEDYMASGVYVFVPKLAFAWSQGLANATRWHIPGATQAPV
jgi:general stress protein 26